MVQSGYTCQIYRIFIQNINGTDEGKVFWIHPDEILGKTYANNFHIYLPLFFDNKYTEAFGIWDDEVPAWVEYK